MSWIKLEKDLLTDPRVMRMSRTLETHLKFLLGKGAPGEMHNSNGVPLQGVTLVLGGLTRLWMLADTHLGEDDVLPIGPGDVDQLVGIPGFHAICPPEWLEVLDPSHVKLPGYHTHNGSIAKKKAVTQKRVERFRKRNLKPLQLSNAPQLLDQTTPDLDQTIPIKTPQGVCETAWQEWITYRRKHRFAVDPVTLSKHTKLLARYSQTTQREIIDASIGSSWQGLFAPKGKPANGSLEPSTARSAVPTTRSAEMDRAFEEGLARAQARELEGYKP